MAAAGALLVLHAIPAVAAPGALDPSFGAGGRTTTDLGRNGDLAYDAVLQPDGRIVVAGSSGHPLRHRFTVGRYHADGTPDSSFGAQGTVTTDFGGRYQFAGAVALQPDGKIVAAGVTGEDHVTAFDFALARYNTDGTLDTTFGTGGKVVMDVGGDSDFALALAIQPDGRIVVAGMAGEDASQTDFALVRYTVDGRLDTTFGGTGTVRTRVGAWAGVFEVLFQPDGKLVAAGRAGNLPGGRMGYAVARYDADGSLDTSFGTGGVALDDFTGYGATAAVIQPDGRIVVGGRTSTYDDRRSDDFLLARYQPDGSLDTTFGSDGVVTTNIDWYDEVHALALDADGAIVAAGFGGDDFALARYRPDGDLDRSFGSAGKVTTDFAGYSDVASAVIVQPDGRILAVGSRIVLPEFDQDWALARYLGGSVDTAPTVGVLGGRCRGAAAAASIGIVVRDDHTPADELTVSATSSDQGLLPDDGLVLRGSGDRRTLDLTAVPERAGTATVTLTADDGSSTTTVDVTVVVGRSGGDVVVGTVGPDVVLGMNGHDAASGAGGDDLLCGGGGDDRLEGGGDQDVLDGGVGADRLSGGAGRDRLLGADGDDVLSGGTDGDFFSGGEGEDTATDFTPAEGDTQDGTVP